MALQTTDPPAVHSAQIVANAFVEQYYHILHHSPELVYRFYQDSSVLSRQEENGKMTSVTTMEGINAKILSLGYKNYKAEIKTADAQDSYKDGVIVLVTGCLTGKDNIRKKFAQSFFLAPQSKGFFVLNDVFRFVDESEPLETSAVTIAKANESGSVPVVPEIEPLRSSDASTQEVTPSNEDNQIHVEKPTQTFENDRHVAREEEVLKISESTEDHLSAVTESSQISSQDDGAKNSYASIVKKAKGSPRPTKVYVPTNTLRSAPRGTEGQASRSVPSAAAAEQSVDRRVPNSGNDEEGAEIEGHSVYVRNLPMNVTVTQLEQEFKRFGQIKQEGVQVRSNRQQGTCYGFVEFFSASSVDSAMQAAPIMVEGRQAFVEIKRSGTRVDSGRGRFPFGKGGFRSDSFRGRGGYGGGGRGFGGRGEYSSRGRGQAGHRVDGYQRGRGRAGRQSGVNRSNVAP